MDLPLAEIGEKASALLLERLKEKENSVEIPREPIAISVPCSLVERQSVKRLVP